MNTCSCTVLKEFRPTNPKQKKCYQCTNLKCLKIYTDSTIGNIEEKSIVRIEKTKDVFKSFIRKPVKKD